MNSGLGFNHVHIQRGVPVNGTQLPSGDLRVPGVPDDPRVNGLTLFAPSRFARVGDPRFAPTILTSQERQITDSAQRLVRHAHTIKIGGETAVEPVQYLTGGRASRSVHV